MKGATQMSNIRLTNNKTGETTIVEANKTVLKWLWENYYRIGYDEIEDLTAMGLA